MFLVPLPVRDFQQAYATGADSVLTSLALQINTCAGLPVNALNLSFQLSFVMHAALQLAFATTPVISAAI